MSKIVDTDVLIVGAGVAGLTAAALLAREGTSAITISKYTSTANTPRAHITNLRTLEVMRDLGIEDNVYKTGMIMTEVPHTTYTVSLADREFARRETWGTRVDRLADFTASSPSKMVNIGQHLLEPIINRRAVELGADIRFLTELEEISQDDASVLATVRYRPTGETYRIRAKYVIGADGGRSVVADQLGFEYDGPGVLGHALNAWFEADLTRYVAHRPGVLYFTNHPGREFIFGSGSFLLVRPWNEWVIQFSYDPETDDLDTRSEVIIPRIQFAIGDDTIPITLKGMNKWQINSLVAREYRRGRTLLVGDAAHRHSPGGGLGSNTSIQDSYNLAWKLAAVLRGDASESLLDTYDQERQPIGAQVVERATHIVEISADISRALGVRAGQSVDEGWAALNRMFEPTPEGEAQRDGLNKALDHLDNGWNEQGFEMSHRFTAGAVVDDGTPWPVPDRDPNLYFQPTTHAGAKLPHAWVERGQAKVSTLDVVPVGSWGIITGPGGEAWRDAAAQVADETGLRIATVAIGPGLDFEDRWGAWASTREIRESGCLVIRPDKHVAWRSAESDADPASRLREVFGALLGER